MSFVCSTCNDTHRMTLEGLGDVMCTHCPVPCQRCRYKNGAYCDDILGPCTCSCHPPAAPSRADVSLVAGLTAAWEAAQLTPCDPDDYSALDSDMVREIRGITDAAGFDGIPFLDDAVRHAIGKGAPALRVKNAELVHVLKQLREVIQPSVTVIIGSYIVMTPDIDVEWAHGVRHRVEKVGREIDDALIAFADDVAVKERAELQRQYLEARDAADVQADVIADQVEEIHRLRNRLHLEQLKTYEMTQALGEVWEQVPDEDRIGKPMVQWVRGLGRRVRELTAAPLGRGCDCGTPSTIHDVARPSAEDERTV